MSVLGYGASPPRASVHIVRSSHKAIRPASPSRAFVETVMKKSPDKLGKGVSTPKPTYANSSLETSTGSLKQATPPKVETVPLEKAVVKADPLDPDTWPVDHPDIFKEDTQFPLIIARGVTPATYDKFLSRDGPYHVKFDWLEDEANADVGSVVIIGVATGGHEAAHRRVARQLDSWSESQPIEAFTADSGSKDFPGRRHDIQPDSSWAVDEEFSVTHSRLVVFVVESMYSEELPSYVKRLHDVFTISITARVQAALFLKLWPEEDKDGNFTGLAIYHTRQNYEEKMNAANDEKKAEDTPLSPVCAISFGTRPLTKRRQVFVRKFKIAPVSGYVQDLKTGEAAPLPVPLPSDAPGHNPYLLQIKSELFLPVIDATNNQYTLNAICPPPGPAINLYAVQRSVVKDLKADFIKKAQANIPAAPAPAAPPSPLKRPGSGSSPQRQAKKAKAN